MTHFDSSFHLIDNFATPLFSLVALKNRNAMTQITRKNITMPPVSLEEDQCEQGTVDEVTFTAKLSVKGKKAKWYIRNQVGAALGFY